MLCRVHSLLNLIPSTSLRAPFLPSQRAAHRSARAYQSVAAICIHIGAAQHAQRGWLKWNINHSMWWLIIILSASPIIAIFPIKQLCQPHEARPRCLTKKKLEHKKQENEARHAWKWCRWAPRRSEGQHAHHTCFLIVLANANANFASQLNDVHRRLQWNKYNKEECGFWFEGFRSFTEVKSE